jgi:hypothetical protein
MRSNLPALRLGDLGGSQLCVFARHLETNMPSEFSVANSSPAHNMEQNERPFCRWQFFLPSRFSNCVASSSALYDRRVSPARVFRAQRHSSSCLRRNNLRKSKPQILVTIPKESSSVTQFCRSVSCGPETKCLPAPPTPDNRNRTSDFLPLRKIGILLQTPPLTTAAALAITKE